MPVFTAMIETMKINKENMRMAAKGGFMNATDAADWLVKHGVPFRDAHAVIGQMVLYCIENSKALEDLSIEEMKKFSGVFDESVFEAISLEKCVEARRVDGGPSKWYIEKLIAFNEEFISGL